MSKPGKDSPEVVEFMALFARLKDWSDDDPEGRFDIAAAVCPSGIDRGGEVIEVISNPREVVAKVDTAIAIAPVAEAVEEAAK